MILTELIITIYKLLINDLINIRKYILLPYNINIIFYTKVPNATV